MPCHEWLGGLNHFFCSHGAGVRMVLRNAALGAGG